MHIGRLSAKLTPGVFVIEDLLIEGLTPTDRPFLKAKKIEVRLPWWTAFSSKLIIESVTMTDWDMVVESWPGGRHSFPKVTPKNPRTGPSRFTTTLRYVLATRGQFTYDDHATPWSTVARNLTLQLHRSDADQRLSRHAPRSRTAPSRFRPISRSAWTCRSRFSLNGGKVHFDRMDLTSDGARTVGTGDVDLGRWPEQLYQLQSRIDFPTQKDIFFHGQKFDVSGVGDFTGTFHLFKGGRELKGAFVSAAGRRQRLAVSEPARIRAVAAGSTRDHERHERALRRHGAVRLPDGAVRPADAGARDVGRRVQGRRSRAGSRTFSRPRGCACRAARRAATASSGRSGSGR